MGDFDKSRLNIITRLEMLERLSDYSSIDNYITLDKYNGEVSYLKLSDIFLYIGGMAFAGNKYLIELRTNKHLKTIDTGALRGCRNLKTVILNEGLEKISNSAFAITGIEKIVIPSIGRAMYSPNLKEVHMLSNYLRLDDIYQAFRHYTENNEKTHIHFRSDRSGIDIGKEAPAYKDEFEISYDL